MTYQELLDAYDGLPQWWHWKNFEPKEVACKCCGELWPGDDIDPPAWFIESMDTLQRLRNQWGRPIIINSGHRCAERNRKVGGVSNSRHMTHIAFDCRCVNEDEEKFGHVAQNAQFRYVRLYKNRNFVHVDIFKRTKDWTLERDYSR